MNNQDLFFSDSDLDLKENLVVIQNALTKVGLMTGYTYDWKADTEMGIARLYGEGLQDTGVIAQQVDALGFPGIRFILLSISSQYSTIILEPQSTVLF